MNIFGGQDHVRKLETQLKQKTVQMDNLDNALSVTKKELAEQRREKELAEQELSSKAAKLNELEEQTDKVNKLVKQRHEYTFSLSSQLEAKTKEVQQRDEQLQQEKTTVYQMSKELEDERSQKKTLETEVARVNSSFAQVAQKLKELQHERGKEVDGLQDELLSAQHSLDQQRAQLQDAAVRMHSGQLDQENRGLSIDSLRSKLTETENMLAAERINFNREMGALQAKCAEAEAKVSEARTNSDRLQKAASAADQKVSKLGMELKAKMDDDLRAKKPTGGTVDVAKFEREKDQLKQQTQTLSAKVKEAQDQVQQHQTLVLNATTEVEALRSQIEAEKKHSRSLETRIENMQLSLTKLQQQSSTAAASSESEQARACTDLEESERKIEKLEADKRGLVEEKQTLDTKLRRGSEAIKKVSKEQEKLESKLQKLSSDRDGAVSESKAAKAKVACLERDIVDMTRCNAKNKQDLDEARSRASMLKQQLADVRGQLAEAQLPPPPSPGSTGVGPGGEKQRMALREQCTALGARLQEANQDAENLRAQLKEEKAQNKQAQQALVDEQQYFMNKLADMETITKGEAVGTPGGQLHTQIQSMKSRLSVAADSSDAVSMQPPVSMQPSAVTPLRPRSSNVTPRSRMSLASRGTELSLCTPRSHKAAQESAKYWHRKYEEQSVKVASLESMHRKQERELLRSGGGVDCVSLASMSQPPQSHTPKLGGLCSRNWEADGHEQVNRELFGGESLAGEENDATPALTPTVLASAAN